MTTNEPKPKRRKPRVRVVPGSQAGYGHNSGWLAQYWDTDIKVWFDIGDPHDSETDARRAADDYEKAPRT